jgi:hypothetical protein
MIRRRRALAVVSAGAAMLGLTGCEAPTPIVTLQSGTAVVKTEASRWCFGGVDRECRETPLPVTRLEATPGQRMIVDVDGKIADRGWYVELEVVGGDQTSASDPRDEHTLSLVVPPQPVQLTVRALDGGDLDRSRQTGSWTFLVTPKD